MKKYHGALTTLLLALFTGTFAPAPSKGYRSGPDQIIRKQLLTRLGIDLPLTPENMQAIQEHPAMREYQAESWHKRVDRMKEKPPRPRGMGEPGRNNPWMPERLIPYFTEWLKNEYNTLENLKQAWICLRVRCYPRGRNRRNYGRQSRFVGNAHRTHVRDRGNVQQRAELQQGGPGGSILHIRTRVGCRV